MGKRSLTVSDVPEDRLQVEIALMEIDYRTVTTTEQRKGVWTVTGTDPRDDGPEAGARVGAGAQVPAPVAAPAGNKALNDVEILARTLWGEGRSGSDAGLEAIATVVMNRLAAPGQRFGRTVREVCLQPKQFSCWNANDPNRPKIDALRGDEPSLVRCRAVARRAIAGGLADATFGAVHYHHHAILPDWAQGKQPCIEVDDHVFYNNVA